MRSFTVGKLNRYISGMLSEELFIQDIELTGEISSLSFSGSNTYFELSDNEASIQCVFFNSRKKSLDGSADDFEFKAGDSVAVTGSPSMYIKSGKLNFKVESIRLHGKGDKYRQLAELKERLHKEGVFDKKRPRPARINKICVITSSDGAVIHDIISVAKRRNPNVSIALYPCKVQGQYAENSICQAIKDVNLNMNGIDAIIIARGGGSEEELNCFNTECVARAVYESAIFTVSAVGHEINYTFCDFAADMRAPTPSAAAEIAVDLLGNDYERLYALIDRLNCAMDRVYKGKVFAFRSSAEAVNSVIAGRLDKMDFGLKSVKERLGVASVNFINGKRRKLDLLENTVNNLNPRRLLSGGYAKIMRGKENINGVAGLNPGDEINIYMSDGSIGARVAEISKESSK